jgi:GT2 family glycosyltransferase
MDLIMVCVVLLNWNRPEDTLTCLQSLLDLKDDRLLTIVVCDNGSSDDSVQQIMAWAKCSFGSRHIAQTTLFDVDLIWPKRDLRLVLIENQKNLGFAAGCNPGIRFALNRKCQFVWLLNNDTQLHADALSSLLACAEKQPEVGIWGSAIVDYHQRNRVQCAGGCHYWPLTTIFKYAAGGRSLDDIVDHPPVKDLTYIYGASMFIRSSVFDCIGLLNEAYFLFYEEIDFCLRSKFAGYPVKWCPDSIVYHQQSKSFENFGQSRHRTRVANYHENLSTLIFTARFYPQLFLAACLIRFFGKVITIVLRRDWHLIQPLICAYMDFFKGLVSGRFTFGSI